MSRSLLQFCLLCTAFCLDHNVVTATTYKHGDLIYHQATDQFLLPPIRPPHHTTTASAEGATPPLQVTTLCGTSIKGHLLEYATTGHGGTERMRSNPLLFFVQHQGLLFSINS
ncbi:uncharacterized protein LOC142590651 [Dermacentor variabilis]|uniref:uncharacterized protein LOC142590651 n=1 Tax=Dermacentor variabilis TaxID=34621 RepID=UPI003F5C49DE